MPTADCLAAMESAVVFDLSHRSQLAVRGQDRVTFLHNFCTNDIRRLQPGTSCEAFVCNAKGRVLGHITVFADSDQLLLESVPGAATALATHLDRYIIREDVTLHDLSGEQSACYLTGPQSPHFLEQWLAVPADDFAQLPLRAAWIGNHPTGAELTLRSVDWLGSPGWLVCGSAAHLAAWQRELASHGAASGTKEGWESLRIAAGWPEYGRDISDENLPQEAARNDRCLSFTKGCYLGQEPIARLDALGHTNRELRRIRGSEGPCPAAGTELKSVETGEIVGKLTSAAPAPSGSGWVGLGQLKTKWTSPGTQIAIDAGFATVETAY